MMDFNKDSYLNFKSDVIGFLRKSGLSRNEAKRFFHYGYQALGAEAGDLDSENPTAKDSASEKTSVKSQLTKEVLELIYERKKKMKIKSKLKAFQWFFGLLAFLIIFCGAVSVEPAFALAAVGVPVAVSGVKEKQPIQVGGGNKDTGDPGEIRRAAEELHREFTQIKSGLKSEISGELDLKLEKMSKYFTDQMAVWQPGVSVSDGKKESEVAKQMIRSFMQSGTIDPGLKEKLISVSGEKQTAFTISGNEFIIPAEIDRLIFRELVTASDLISRVHFAQSTSVDYRKIIMGAIAAQRAGESTTRQEQNAPATREVAYTGGELYALFQASNWALDDAGFGLEEEFLATVRDAFRAAIEQEILTGLGAAQNEMTGLLTLDVSQNPAVDELRQVPLNGANITYADLLNLVYSVPQSYRQGASFTINPSVLATVRGLKDDDGNLIFRPAQSEGESGILLGYPVTENDEMSVSGKLALFGNLERGYSVNQVHGTRIIRDPYTVKGQVLFYVYSRVRGGFADLKGLSVLTDNSIS